MFTSEGDSGYVARLGAGWGSDRRDIGDQWLGGERWDAAPPSRSEGDEATAGVARRLQSRVDRHLWLLERLAAETRSEPAELPELLDTGARMRRDTESLLLLCGDEPGVRDTGPRRLDELMYDAADLAEEPHLVEPRSAPAATIDGAAAVEFMHVLAELVDQTAEVHPGARLELVGRSESGGVTVDVLTDAAGQRDPDGSGGQRAAAAAEQLAHRSRYGIVLHRPLGGPPPFGTGVIASVHCPPAVVTLEQPAPPVQAAPPAPVESPVTRTGGTGYPQYASDQFAAYPGDQYSGDQYSGDQYSADPYPGDQYAGGQYSSDPYLGDQYAAEADRPGVGEGVGAGAAGAGLGTGGFGGGLDWTSGLGATPPNGNGFGNGNGYGNGYGNGRENGNGGNGTGNGALGSGSGTGSSGTGSFGLSGGGTGGFGSSTGGLGTGGSIFGEGFGGDGFGGGGFGNGNGNGNGDGYLPPDAPSYSPSSSSHVDELFGPLLDLPLEPMDDRYATPIFEAIASAWFREGGAEGGTDLSGDPQRGPLDWETPQDNEWREAAARAARSEPVPTTATGLPRRLPGNQLVPPPRSQVARQTAGGTSERVPDRVRDRLSTYQRGLRQGRHRAPGEEPQEPQGW